MKETGKAALMSTGLAIATVGLGILNKNLDKNLLGVIVAIIVIGLGAVFTTSAVFLMVHQATERIKETFK